MGTQTLTKWNERMPSAFDDFFKPWNQWFGNENLFGMSKIPPVIVTDNKEDFTLSLAAPGLTKEDFKIDVDGNMLTISSEKEETNEEKDEKFTRKEYNYTSFCRSFNLPEEVNKEKIDAAYKDGVLKVTLPKNDAFKKAFTAKKIAVK
jgi:HSP20 family protein